MMKFVSVVVTAVVDDRKVVVARYEVGMPAVIHLNDTCNLRQVMEMLRSLADKGVTVAAQYPRVSGSYFLINQQELNMDIESYMLKKNAENNAATEKPVKTIFVGPSTGAVPDDGVLNYVTAESVFDLEDVPERSVVLFPQQALPHLKLASENTALLGLRMIVLSGVPGMEYTTEFDSCTWNLERAAYHTLVNDLRVAADVEAQLAAQSATLHDRERAQVSRADGSVRDLTAVDAVGPRDLIDDKVIE